MIAPRHPDELHRLASIVEVVFGADVYSRSRHRYIVDGRMVFSLLLNEQGVGCSEIGRILGRNHATVLHYFRRGNGLLETDARFRKNYVLCREQYVGEDPVYYYTNPELRKKFIELRGELDDMRTILINKVEREKKEKRLQPILDLVRTRTKQGKEEEVLLKINRVYNGL
jgi:hypothetical protein